MGAGVCRVRFLVSGAWCGTCGVLWATVLYSTLSPCPLRLVLWQHSGSASGRARKYRELSVLVAVGGGWERDILYNTVQAVFFHAGMIKTN